MGSVQREPGVTLQENWEHAVARLHAELHRIASREECEDAVQEAIAAALANSDAPALRNPAGWLLVVGRRRVLDTYRARAGRHQDTASSRRYESDAALEQLATLDPDIAELLDAPGTEATDTFNALDEPTRRILTLHLAGLNAQELAQAIGAPSDIAARRRLTRAWEALRRLFIATERDADCGAVRTTLAALTAPRTGTARPQASGTLDYQRVTAHLELCPHCRAFQKRAKGLLINNPTPTVPVWQQIAQRIAETFPGSSSGRSAEAAAGTLLGGGGAKFIAALCAGALATGGVCTTLILGRDGTTPPAAATTTTTRARAAVQREQRPHAASPIARPRAKHTSAPRTRARNASTSATSTKTQRDTRQAEQAQPAAAPAGSDQTSELLPTGSAGSNASTPPAPAPSTGGGEFLP